MKPAVAFILAAALFLTGCASYRSNVNNGVDLKKYQRVWVKSNMDDNRGIAKFLTEALRARGLESDYGPLTMMPLNTQAYISYRDSWTWDFKDHMTGLEISFYDTKQDFPIASANFTGPTSMSAHPHDVAEKLVTKLYSQSNKTK